MSSLQCATVLIMQQLILGNFLVSSATLNTVQGHLEEEVFAGNLTACQS